MVTEMECPTPSVGFPVKEWKVISTGFMQFKLSISDLGHYIAYCISTVAGAVPGAFSLPHELFNMILTVQVRAT